MRILIDAMGGDNAPQAPVMGALRAVKELGVSVTLIGQMEKIEPLLNGGSGVDIVDAREIVTMEAAPSTATRRKKDASMAVALKMLRAGEGDAVVSAGSTGALLTGATLTVKRIPGIRRAALAPVLPNGARGVMLIDCGANVECTPEYLLQFAYMGSFYADKIMGCPRPRVGLLSNGTEPTKGAPLQKQTFKLLQKASEAGRINFIGNVEGNDVMAGGVDVVVTDGFTGNVFLKASEGMIKFALGQLKNVFYGSTKNKLAALALKRDFMAMRDGLDVNKIGGTALLGISRPVIKAHGSSNDEAIFSAIRQAVNFSKAGVIEEIEKNIEHMRLDPDEAAEMEETK